MRDITKDPYALIEEIEAEKEAINSKIFIPTWDNKPEKKEPILFLNNVGILTYQNVSCIIAAPGIGKSSICESICAAAIGTPGTDTLGLTVSKEITRVLYLDNERTQDDVWNSFERTHRRALTYEKTIKDKSIDIVGLRMVAALKERKETIESIISKGKYQLIIIDGAGDLVQDTNNLAEAIECRIWFRELTSKYNVSILTTLHPNKGTLTPRGHIGSEIMREAETVLGVEKSDEVRTMTTDFAHGKSRNATGASGSFVWNVDFHMFVQCDVPGKSRKKLAPQEQLSNEEMKAMLNKLFKVGPLNYSELLSEVKAYLKQNYPEGKSGMHTAKEFISYLTQNQFIRRTPNGVTSEYDLLTTHTQSQLL